MRIDHHGHVAGGSLPRIRPQSRWDAGVGGALLRILIAAVVVVAASASAPAEASQPLSATPEMEVFSAGSALTAAQESELNALVNSTNFAARTFDLSSAVGAGASTVGTADYASLLAARGWTVVGNDAALILPSSGAQPMLTVGAQCRGTSGYTGFFGAFWQWALNSCDTATLIAAVAAGGGSTAAIGGLLASLGLFLPEGLRPPWVAS